MAEDRPPHLEKLFRDDGYLRTHEEDILMRWRKYQASKSALQEHEGGLDAFSRGYESHGIVQQPNGDVLVRERERERERVDRVQ